MKACTFWKKFWMAMQKIMFMMMAAAKWGPKNSEEQMLGNGLLAQCLHPRTFSRFPVAFIPCKKGSADSNN